MRQIYWVLGLMLGLLLGAERSWAQAPAAAGSATTVPQKLAAVRLKTPIKLDGVLDDAAWQQAPATARFTELEPVPGRLEKYPTEVRVLYDDDAIYVGALLHDAAPDSVLRELSQRDEIGNSDWFGVWFDTYHDRLNGYGFIVTSGGVQVDARYSPAGGEDNNWNAVWDSRTGLQGTDWVAELRIPYSALRFAKAPEQLWGLNFGRQRRATRQKFFWQPIVPQINGFVNQWGDLAGLRDVVPPLRLSLTPYVSAYLNHYPYSGTEGKRSTSTSFNGGADVKWGINESFTLDATLVPDFGQVQSDNQVLNLSPFEVQFQENRQFFTEGTELFNKGNLFYSRRVGAQPIGYSDVEKQLGRREKLLENPGITQLLNATKVSGRTGKNLGVGVFNALSGDIFATVRNDSTGQERRILTQPLTNYNIVVLDQSLAHNSFVSLINTNVTRQGATYDANVTGGLLRLTNKANTYAFDGRLLYSHRQGRAFGGEREVDDRNGYKYQLSYGKVSGAFTWSLNHGIESSTYNPNDLGLLFANNSFNQNLDMGYNIFKPFWKVNRLNTYWGVAYNLLEKPRRYADAGIYGGANTTFTKNFLTAGINFDLSPASRDYFDPRREPIGRYYVFKPATFGLNGFLSSDYRRAFAWDVNFATRHFAADGNRTDRDGFDLGFSPRYRVNNHLNFRFDTQYNLRRNQIGYVVGGLKSSQPLDTVLLRGFGGPGGDPLLGRRRVVTFTNTVSAAYTFTNRISLTLRMRHYTSTVQHRDFSRLRPDGLETPVEYQRNRDNTFNAFNLDAVFSWWFAPGSQVSIVWKNAASSLAEAERASPLYFDNLNATINTPHNNNLSVKVLYFLDYLALRPRRG